VTELPKTSVGFELGKQIVRSGTSIGANYRSSQRGRSRVEFISKLSIVQEEADETVFWLELIFESGILTKERIKSLPKEACELTAIFTTMTIIAKRNSQS
jgi:four helix bundle protein